MGVTAKALMGPASLTIDPSTGLLGDAWPGYAVRIYRIGLPDTTNPVVDAITTIPASPRRNQPVTIRVQAHDNADVGHVDVFVDQSTTMTFHATSSVPNRRSPRTSS